MMAVCPRLIVGVVVVSEHEGMTSMILSVPVQVADSSLLMTVIVKVY